MSIEELAGLKDFDVLFANVFGAVTPPTLTVLSTTNIAEYPDLAECFSADMRLLTEDGFLSLNEYGYKDPTKLRFACYNPTTQQIEYHVPTAVIVKPSPYRLVEFTSIRNGRSEWDETVVDEYGRMSDDGDTGADRSGHISVMVTPNHDMWAARGKSWTSGQVAWERKPYAKYTAASLRDQVDGFDACCFQTTAPAGVSPILQVIPQLIMKALSLRTDDQFNAFLELFGFWIGDGSLVSARVVGTAVRKPYSVSFVEKKQSDRDWLHKQLRLCGLVEGQSYRVCLVLSSLSEQFDVTDPSWVAFFFKEYGRKYQNTENYEEPIPPRTVDDTTMTEEDITQLEADAAAALEENEYETKLQRALLKSLKSALQQPEPSSLTEQWQLLPEDKEPVDCGADANCAYHCMFCSLSRSLTETEDHCKEYRQLAMKEISDNPQYYEPFIAENTGETVDAYVARVSPDRAWGDHIDLIAFGRGTDTTIIVHQPRQAAMMIHAGTNRHRVAEVGYVNRNHYVAVIRRASSDSTERVAVVPISHDSIKSIYSTDGCPIPRADEHVNLTQLSDSDHEPTTSQSTRPSPPLSQSSGVSDKPPSSPSADVVNVAIQIDDTGAAAVSYIPPASLGARPPSAAPPHPPAPQSKKQSKLTRTKSAKWFPKWILFGLTMDQTRRVLEGYRRADGSRTANHFIAFTSSVTIRDQLITLCLHAGYSPHFQLEYRAGEVRGCKSLKDLADFRKMSAAQKKSRGLVKIQSASHYNQLSNEEKAGYRVIRATADSWKVSSRSDVLNVVISHAKGEVVNKYYAGEVWCVTVPTGLVIAQRAHVDGSSNQVTHVSRPIICGQCFFDMTLRYCNHCPDVIVVSPYLDAVVERAIAAMTVAHEYTATAATAFLTALIADCVDNAKFNTRRKGKTHPIPARVQHIHRILANDGAAIVEALISVLAGAYGVERAYTTVACWEVMILAAPGHVGAWIKAAITPLVRTAAIPARDVEALIQCLVTSRAWENIPPPSQPASAALATSNGSRGASGRRHGSGSYAIADRFAAHIKVGVQQFAEAARMATLVQEQQTSSPAE